MKKYIFIILLLPFVNLGLYADVDDASFFDIKGKCDYNPIDLSSISDSVVTGSVEGMIGTVDPTGNEIHRFNVGAEVY